jgi:hypothetical protein
MTGSILESLLLGFVLLAGLAAVAFLTGGFLLWRYGRRKLRSFRSHGAIVGATALWDVAASNRWNHSGAEVTSAELQQWSAARVGKEMWRSVDRASDIDKVLRVDPAAPVPSAVGEQVLEVMRAAIDVQQAAMTSAGEASSQRIRDLTEDAGHELTLLDAGLASMRSSGRTELPR